MQKGRNLLSLRHEDLKEAIVRLLKNRLKAGGRGSIKRSILQRELTRADPQPTSLMTQQQPPSYSGWLS